jgi:hypothetical protein
MSTGLHSFCKIGFAIWAFGGLALNLIRFFSSSVFSLAVAPYITGLVPGLLGEVTIAGLLFWIGGMIAFGMGAVLALTTSPSDKHFKEGLSGLLGLIFILYIFYRLITTPLGQH